MHPLNPPVPKSPWVASVPLLASRRDMKRVMKLKRTWDLHIKKWSPPCWEREVGIRPMNIRAEMTIPLMPTTLLVPTIRSNITQNQLVILKDSARRGKIPKHRAPRLASSVRPWKSLSAPTKTRSTMPRVCAITVITSTAEIATPMLALIPIDSCMLRANARTAISMTTTSSSEDSRKTKLEHPFPLNSWTAPMSLRDLSSETYLLTDAYEGRHQTPYLLKSADRDHKNP